MLTRDLSVLTEQQYDLVVLGGGIFGVFAAWDAVLRGMSVALVEKGDFCGGVSANSYKIVHGGIRYIQHGDVVRVRASCRERSALLRVAPHLVQPLPIVMPTYGYGKDGKMLLSAGLFTYDTLTFDRNRDIDDPQRHIPWGRTLSRTKVLELFPGLQRDRLTGGAVFFDGQIYNPPRLALSVLRSAVAAGAHAANYVEAIDFLQSSGRIAGVEVQDRLTGDCFEIRSRAVLNATGPWAEGLLRRSLDITFSKPGVYSRDACFVVPQRLVGSHAIAIQGCTKDPDAILSRRGRHLFVVPWRDYSLVGVWHVVYDRGPDAVNVTETELQGFIHEVNEVYPELKLRLEDVLLWNAGLVPFGENQPGATDLSYGKRSIIIDHARTHQRPGLVTLVGIRYTMARGDAARAVDLIAKQLNLKAPRAATDKIPIHGGQIGRFESYVELASRESQLALPPAVIRALLHNYGSEYRRVLSYAKENSSLLDAFNGSTVIKAEVVHAVREEMALRLADVVLRRTDLGTGKYPGKEALRACAALMACELGWTSERVRLEVDEVTRSYPTFVRKNETVSELPVNATQS